MENHILELHYFQQDTVTFTDKPLKFPISQLRNGNYVLSKLPDYARLECALLDWNNRHSQLQNLSNLYQTLLETKKIELDQDSSNLLKNQSLESDYDIVIDSLEQSSLFLEDQSFAFDDKDQSLWVDDTPKLSQNFIKRQPKGDQLFVGCNKGSLLEYSISEKTVVHDYGKILKNDISSIAISYDYKSQFVCDWNGGFREFDMETRKQTNHYGIKNALKCLVTRDNKFLITAEYGQNKKLSLWSMATYFLVNSWSSNVCQYIFSQNISYDNKFQFTGFNGGWLGIYNIKTNRSITNIQVLSGAICSVVFKKDRLGAYIADLNGNIKLIQWTFNATSENNFDFTNYPVKVGNYHTYEICLTSQDTNLLVGSTKFLRIFNIRTKTITKTFDLNDHVLGINQINGNTSSVMVAEKSGKFSIIGLENEQISKTFQIDLKGKNLLKTALI